MITIECSTGELVQFAFDSFSQIDLSSAELHRAILNDKDLSNSLFVKTNFRGAEFQNSILYNSNLIEARLMVARFDNACLKKCDLKNAFLNGAVFKGANLESSDLTGANVFSSDFSQAVLLNSIMLCESIETAIFLGAKYNKYTKWPNNFNPKLFGAILID